MRLVREFLLGALAGVGEVAVRVAHHPLRTVVVVHGADVHGHFRILRHELSVSGPPAGVNYYASASASSPASSRSSGTSARLIPLLSNASTISMPYAFCPAVTGTAANDL